MIEENSKVTNDLAALRAMRDRHGAKSLVGRLCSNLIPMVRNMPTHVRPSWATHESQTLSGKIRWQLGELKLALAATKGR